MGRSPSKQSHHSAKFGEHRYCVSKFIMVLTCHVLSQYHVIKGLCDFMGRSPQGQVRWSYRLWQWRYETFIGLRARFKSSGLIPQFFLSLKAQGLLCQYTRNFTIKRTLTTAFASVSNDINPIFVTRFLGYQYYNIGKELSLIRFSNSYEKEEE